MKKKKIKNLELKKTSISNLGSVTGGKTTIVIIGGTTGCPTGPAVCDWPTTNDMCDQTHWGPGCNQN